MERKQLLCLMADYNQWMNDKLIAAARTLPHEALMADRKAYFGSILATLNHLVVGDTIWLKRFANHPARYAALAPMHDVPMPSISELNRFSELAAYETHRRCLDAVIVDWARSVEERDLDVVLHYANSRGEVADRSYFGLVMHFFNHQTHHRGQITTLLSQVGVDVGSTDLLVRVPDLSKPAQDKNHGG